MNSVAAAVPSSKTPRFKWPLVWSVVVASLIAWGSHAHLERYITPQRGLGYWLGITGGSMMLLLLIYSARKRFAWLRWLGGIPAWFEIHMMLGVVGPLLVLFHANFRLGATNSNVALICMLVVAGKRRGGALHLYAPARASRRQRGHARAAQGGRRAAALANDLHLVPAGSARCDRPGGAAIDRAAQRDSCGGSCI